MTHIRNRGILPTTGTLSFNRQHVRSAQTFIHPLRALTNAIVVLVPAVVDRADAKAPAADAMAYR